MANSAISQLTLATSGLSADEFAIGDIGSSEKITLSQIAKFTNASGMLVSLANNATPTSATAMVRVSGMDVVVGAGSYVFEYYIRAQFAALTQSIKLAVNHTGTTTSFMYDMFHPGNSSVQTSAVLDQENTSVIGTIWCVNTTRTKNATLGPQNTIDTINADIMIRIMGTMIVTVTGTFELYVGAENASNGNITIMAGTCLILKKVG